MKPLLALLLLLPAAAAAQEILVDLPPAPPGRPLGFTVERVIDTRADTSALGVTRVGARNEERPVRLAGGTEGALRRYFSGRLPADSGAVPVVVRIEAFRVSEVAHRTTEIARAEVHLHFYRIGADDQLGDLGRVEAYTERRGTDATRFHGENVRDVLDEALRLFAGSGWQAHAAAVASGSAPPPATATPPPAGSTFLQSALVATPVAGWRAFGGGLAYAQYLGFGEWLVPISLAVNVLSVENPDDEVSGLFVNAGPTVGVIRRLNHPALALGADVQASIGTETVEYADGEEKGTFGGVRLSQSLLYLPRGGRTFFGIGLYQSRLFGSSLYPKDVGVQATLGLRLF